MHGEYIDSSMRLCSFIYTRKQYLRPRTHRLRRSSTRPISPTPSVRTALRVYSSEELDNKVHSQFCNYCVIIASLEIYVTSENGICVNQSRPRKTVLDIFFLFHLEVDFMLLALIITIVPLAFDEARKKC